MQIAVIGSGISGMSAAWLLSQRHQVTVFEKEGRLGGHSNTVDVEIGARTVPVDAGFIVYNEHTYPNLSALFRYLGVPTKDSDMSFSVSIDDGALEYSGTDLNGLFGQRRNLVRPRQWSMIRDILRFYREAPRDLNLGRLQGLTLGQYLSARNYRAPFVEDHLLPMAAAIWSCPLSAMLDHSAASFVKFFENHGLLRIQDRPIWRTVDGGSRQYIRHLTAAYADRIHVNRGASKIVRKDKGVWVVDDCGLWSHFDHVVIAAHADEALALLSEPTAQERHLLGAIKYQPNRAILHTDPTLMPRRRRLWSSWNYARLAGRGDAANPGIFVTYWMNRLQGVDPARQVFVTLNPQREPAANKILQEFQYMHPLLDREAIIAQRSLWQIQGRHCTWFCGAYFGAGFHEDGLQAGLAVAEQLGGVRRPWRIENESERIAISPLHLEAAE